MKPPDPTRPLLPFPAHAPPVSSAYEVRIYNWQNHVLACIALDEAGVGSSVVWRTGTAMTFRIFANGRRPAIFKGTVGDPLDNPRADLVIDGRCVTMGQDLDISISGLPKTTENNQ